MTAYDLICHKMRFRILKELCNFESDSRDGLKRLSPAQLLAFLFLLDGNRSTLGGFPETMDSLRVLLGSRVWEAPQINLEELEDSLLN
jgi:hypothetical protein